MLESIFYLNKLRKYLGIKDAIKVFLSLRITKTGKIVVKGFRYPFKMRVNNDADSSTFNEVVLRKEYAIHLPFVPKRIIDGGANIGLTSLFFINKYPGANIVAVEPATDNSRFLLDNIKPYSSITFLKSAIWSNKAFLKVVDPGRGANGYVVEETIESDKDAFLATGIADIMKEKQWNTIDVLKLDIEGSEKQVFTVGYEEWLPKTRVLIVETHDRFVKGSSMAVFAAVSKYNFSCKVQGFNFVLFNESLIN